MTGAFQSGILVGPFSPGPDGVLPFCSADRISEAEGMISPPGDPESRLQPPFYAAADILSAGQRPRNWFGPPRKAAGAAP